MDASTLSSQISEINPALANLIQTNPALIPILILQIIMKLIFYPIALYIAAKKQQKTWFVVLFVCLLFLNDFGILPIIYIFLNRDKPVVKKDKSRKKRL